MKKLLIVLFTVIIAVVIFLVLNQNSKFVEVNGVKLEKVEIFKHREPLGFYEFDTSKLQRQDLVKTLKTNNELSIFKKAFYGDAELVSPEIQFELMTPEYDAVIYFEEEKPILRELWLAEGEDKGSYLTGTKLYIISLESTKALYGIINDSKNK